MNARLGEICLRALALGCVLGQCPSPAQAPPLEWRYLHRSPGVDMLPLLREAPDGGWIVAFHGGTALTAFKVTATGRRLWDFQTNPLTDPTTLNFLEVLPDGSLLIFGIGRGTVAGAANVIALRLSSHGKRVDTIRWPTEKAAFGSAGAATLMDRDPKRGFLVANHHLPSANVSHSIVCLSQFRLDGALAWRRYSGGSGIETLLSVTPTDDGGYWAVMRSDSPISGDKTVDEPGLNDLWAVLLSADGEIVRQETRFRDPRLIRKVGEGELYVEVTDVRRTGAGFDQGDLWIYQTDARGWIERDTLLGGTGDELFHQAVPAADGGWFLVCETDLARGGNIAAAQGSLDVWIVKLDARGGLQWQRTYGGRGQDFSPRLIAMPDGGFVFTAHSNSGASGTRMSPAAPGRLGHDLWVMRGDADGRPLWDFAVPMGTGYEIRPAKDGGIALAVAVAGDGAPRTGFQMPSDEILLLKFAPDGVRQEDLLPALRPALSHRAAGAWSFASRIGYNYVVETSPTMRPESWTPVLTIGGDGDEWAFPGLVERGAARQFFRVRTILPEPR